jgi:hypothetical protein
MPKLCRVITKDVESPSTKREIQSELKGRVELVWLTQKEWLTTHNTWLDEFISESEQYGEVFNFKADPSSPYVG